MRQVTGKTNPASAANQVSIQLALDGHSFSLTRQPAARAMQADGAHPEELPAVLTVEIVTPRTLLVPEALFAPAQAACLLAADGKAPWTGETTVWSEPADGVVAVMAVPEEALAQLSAATCRYTTPLLPLLSPAAPTVQLLPVGPYLYIKCWHAGLQLAEVVPAPTEADLLYAMERIGQLFPAETCALRIAGPRARALAKLLKPLYPDTRCE